METGIKISSPTSNGSAYPISMIECGTCQSLGFSYLTYVEAEALLCNGSVSRYCRKCDKKTMWRQLEVQPRQSNLNVV